MVSIINYNDRFLFTALFATINNFLKRSHRLIHLFFFKTFNKRKQTSPFLNHIQGNTCRFGCAIEVLPSDIRKYFSSFLITAVAVVSISMFIFCYWKLYFFMDVNSYVGNKVDLTCLCWCLFDNFGQLSGLCIVSYFASQSLGVLS